MNPVKHYTTHRQIWIGSPPPPGEVNGHFPDADPGNDCIAGFPRAHHDRQCPPACCYAAAVEQRTCVTGLIVLSWTPKRWVAYFSDPAGPPWLGLEQRADTGPEAAICHLKETFPACAVALSQEHELLRLAMLNNHRATARTESEPMRVKLEDFLSLASASSTVRRFFIANLPQGLRDRAFAAGSRLRLDFELRFEHTEPVLDVRAEIPEVM